jgi:murein tripeptide amidase MpaA
MFTGYIIGTDFITVDTYMAYTVYLLQKYVQQDGEVTSLLLNRIIHFLPILNTDTYNYLNEYHIKTNYTKMLYKNRRIDKLTSINLCGESGVGVNLNRNFPVGYDFNSDRSQMACHPSF